MAASNLNLGKASGGVLNIQPADGVTNTSVTIPESGNLVSVSTAVTDNAIARYDGATGKLQDSGVVVDDSGNVGIGVTPSAWSGCNPIQLGNSCGIYGFSNSSTLGVSANSTWNGTNDIYRYSSNTASKYSQSAGTHQWQTAPSGTAGNTITWTNAMTLGATCGLTINTATLENYFAIQAMGADKIYLSGGASYGAFSTGDCGIAAASGYSLKFGSNNNVKMNLDTSGNLLLTSGTGGLGYGAGSGGTVTQLTSKSTAVTLNKPSGRIIMSNASLAADASVYFAVNNTSFSAYDTVKLSGKAWSGRYRIEDLNNSPGQFYIRVTNVSGASQSDPLEIDFTITKGANS